MDNKKELWLYSDDSDNDLQHYGTPRHSGRYPWGSGKNPQRSRDFLSRNDELKAKGVSEKERAKALLGPDATTEDLRNKISIVNESRKLAAVYAVRRCGETGMSIMAISRETGVPPSTVKEYLKEDAVAKASRYTATADALEADIKSKGYIQVGRGAAEVLGVSEKQVTVACQILKDRGYTVTPVQIQQLTTSGKTTVLVAAKKGSTYRDIVDNHMGDIQPPSEAFVAKDLRTGEDKAVKIQPPISIDGKRVLIRYAEEGGKDRDGTVELRRGVDDISLGDSHYAQVRIAVDGKYYMKGMASYGDIPDGYDIVYNTNKKLGTPPEKVYKEMKLEDPGNPFGALIKRQNYYLDKDGNEKQGVMNVVREEGEWTQWSKNLPAQFLAKQSDALAKQQLDLDYKNRKGEYEDICKLTNPVVKAALLEKFSDGCDGAAVKLKAASLPKQAYYVLMPLTDLKENEIYAPNFKDGEQVALVRFPHAGTYEIPLLTVNNKRSKTANTYLKNAPDAVGISMKAAEKLSGADFDGDTAILIPNREGRIQSRETPAGLKGYEPKDWKYPSDVPHEKVGGKKKETFEYKKADGTVVKVTGDGFSRGREMGLCTNLIMDMTLAGASDDELVRATKYSMVCTDAEKHDLDWRAAKSYYNIPELYKKYTGSARGGGSTLITRAKGNVSVQKRGRSYIDPETGEKVYTPAKGSQFINKEGKLITKHEKTARMDTVSDATDLVSDKRYSKEVIYADYANKCKALGNTARKEILATKMPKKDPVAEKEYAKEVDSLKYKLNEAKKAAVYERQAQIIGTEKFNTWLSDNPHADADEQQKYKGKCIVWARNDLGYDRYRVTFSDREWEAVQKNAVSATMFKELLNNADMDAVRDKAMPKQKTTVSTTTKSRIKAYAKSGFTQAEIADAMGLSESTINKVLSS